MKKKIYSILLWLIALLITIATAYYQRLTGPTHPVKNNENLFGCNIQYKFLRSYTEKESLPVNIQTESKEIKATLMYRRYKSGEDWKEIPMIRKNDRLEAHLPGLPAAAKIEYTVQIECDSNKTLLNDGKTIVARFRGDVPAAFLIPHIILMFSGIFFGVRTGLEAIRKEGNYKWLVTTTLIIIILGGLILGPIVQKYAFGQLWTGFPIGYDLTDNKVLLIFIFWLIAFIFGKKNRIWAIIAAFLMLIVYLIPHSLLGSELDPKTGKMKNIYNAKLNITSKNY